MSEKEIISLDSIDSYVTPIKEEGSAFFWLPKIENISTKKQERIKKRYEKEFDFLNNLSPKEIENKVKHLSKDQLEARYSNKE